MRVYVERNGGIEVTEGEFRPAKAHLDRLGLSKGGTPPSPSPALQTLVLAALSLSLIPTPSTLYPSLTSMGVWENLVCEESCHGNPPSLAAGVKRHWPATASTNRANPSSANVHHPCTLADGYNTKHLYRICSVFFFFFQNSRDLFWTILYFLD